jgi:hypothetical protein
VGRITREWRIGYEGGDLASLLEEEEEIEKEY